MADPITENILEEASPEQLLELYSFVPGVRPVSRMGDRTTAQARLRLALERAQMKLARVPFRPGYFRVVPEDAQTDLRGPGATMRRIYLLVSENPKRPHGAAHRRFALYEEGMTMHDYAEACWEHSQLPRDRALRDIHWDVKMGFIRLEE